MARTKNTERKPSRPPVARFPVIATGKAEREAHYRQKAAATTPTTEAMDWTELNPTLPGSTSPALENTVNRLNEAHLGSTLTMDDVAEIVEDLYADPPTTPTDGAASEAARPEDRQDLPTTSTAPTGSVTSETTGQTSHPPILLARKAMATLVPRKGRPNPPTAAAKCPRQHFREPIEEVKSRRKSRPQALSALGEIKKYQTEVKPILPWLPFVRLIHELLFERGPYRIQREALHALRTSSEEYLVEVLSGGNLACMHRDRCTLAPKDIRLFRRLRGDVDKLGEAPETEEARAKDWARYRKGRLTVAEAVILDTNRRKKLRQLAKLRRERALCK